MRERLERRPFDYQTLRDNRGWYEHVVRLNLIAGMIAAANPRSVLDPAAGDGSLEEVVERIHHLEWTLLGDISVPNVDRMRELYGTRPGWRFAAGDISDIITDAPRVDIIVLSEILEHLEDPDAVLRLARSKSVALIASSPVMRHGQVDDNPEHLWMFDESGYRAMLTQAGWEIGHSALLRFPTMYDFQIWVCA